MILWRLTEDQGELPEGACITEAKYKNVYYLDRCLFEPVQEFEIKRMIEYEDKELCKSLGIEKLLFYNNHELEVFINKGIENGITG